MRAAACIVLVASAFVSGSQAIAPAERVPVVVELFTSEGCSSCPPADALLTKLATEQFDGNIQIIRLALHVTYWDQLGWKDPASLKDATQRQQEYGRVFGDDRIYTPQAVIDGREELVGSDERGVRAAIVRAAARPHARMTMSARLENDESIIAAVTVRGVPADVKERLRALFFITEDGLTSAVKRGENRGRTLHHDAAVRRVSIVAKGSLVDNGETHVEFTAVPREWQRDRLHVIALLQGDKSRRIYGAATARLH